MKQIIIMGFLGIFNLTSAQENLTLSQKLDKVQFFNLISDSVKLELLKKEIDKNFGPGIYYNGDNWLVIPNDSYISSVYKLHEYRENSSTSDFRCFAVWPSDMVGDKLGSYLITTQSIFIKNGLEFTWTDENVDWKRESENVELIIHTIKINNKQYTVYSGNVRDKSRHAAIDYMNNFRMILNDVIQTQKSDLKVILLTAPEYVYFVLLDKYMLLGLKKIIVDLDNKIEE
jgi:hypothetical protein